MQDFAAAFYFSPAWRKCRANYIKSVGGLCEDCLAKGVYTPGVIVHHIKPLTPDNIHDEVVTLGWENLRLVCRDCHAEEHEQRKRRYKVDEFGRVSAR